MDPFRAWYGRSWRRKSLDRDLSVAAASMTGTVLNVGARRRGLFRPPPHLRWIDLDIDAALRPAVVADALRIPLRAASCDTVVATELLEHVADPRGVIAEFARVLRPGGLLVASMPFHVRIHGDPDDHSRLTPTALRAALGDRFEGVDVRPQGHFLLVLADMVRSLAEEGDPLSPRALPVLTALTAPLAAMDGAFARSKVARAYTTGHFVTARRR